MLEAVLQPAFAFAQKDFIEALRSRRLLTASIILGVIFLVTSGALTLVMLGTSPPGSATGVPDPYEVWFNGPSGVLTGFAFGLVPVFLPFLPILGVTRILQRDQDRGARQLFLALPVPPWGPALGRFAGLYGALAIPTAVISLTTAATIYVVAGALPDGGFLAAYVAGNLLLVGLYLILTLAVGTVVSEEFVRAIVVLLWVGFNALRPTAYFIAARMVTILGAKVPTTFQVAWTDVASFTGLYQAFLAPSVLAGLGFVAAPGSAGSAEALAQLVPWVVLAWFVALYLGYAVNLQRIPHR